MKIVFLLCRNCFQIDFVGNRPHLNRIQSPHIRKWHTTCVIRRGPAAKDSVYCMGEGIRCKINFDRMKRELEPKPHTHTRATITNTFRVRCNSQRSRQLVCESRDPRFKWSHIATSQRRHIVDYYVYIILLKQRRKCQRCSSHVNLLKNCVNTVQGTRYTPEALHPSCEFVNIRLHVLCAVVCVHKICSKFVPCSTLVAHTRNHTWWSRWRRRDNRSGIEKLNPPIRVAITTAKTNTANKHRQRWQPEARKTNSVKKNMCLCSGKVCSCHTYCNNSATLCEFQMWNN